MLLKMHARGLRIADALAERLPDWQAAYSQMFPIEGAIDFRSAFINMLGISSVMFDKETAQTDKIEALVGQAKTGDHDEPFADFVAEWQKAVSAEKEGKPFTRSSVFEILPYRLMSFLGPQQIEIVCSELQYASSAIGPSEIQGAFCKKRPSYR